MFRRCLIVAAVTALPAIVFAQAKDHAPVNLQAAPQMRHDAAKSESWTYAKPGLKLSRYRNLMIDQTVVYSGADAQFDDVKAEDQRKYAALVTTTLRAELAKSFRIVTSPGPDTLRLRTTLLGVETTKGGLATATRVTPIGFALSAVNSVAGKEGKFTGSLLVALEMIDGKSGELQYAAVRRRSPDALDIAATLSTSDTVKAAAGDMAETLREKLERAMRVAG